MIDPFGENRKQKNRFRMLELDSWIDSGLFSAFTALARAYESFSAFMFRFRVTGLRRWASELIGDAGTLGTLGAIVVLAFGIPAFEETRGDWLKKQDLSVTFLDRSGNLIGKRGILHNDAVPLEEIPDVVIQAALSTEDRRFFTHIGIDFFGTARALVENIRAQAVVQGGSSITQQLAKNLFLSSERTLERKIKEAYLALWLEARLTKKEILKLYLDRAYMGGGAFGVDAASEFYFGKSVRDVTLAEAAMLAGLFKAPARYAPHINLPTARARANEVLDNMVEAGFLTEGQVFAARLNPASVVTKDDFYSPDFFLDWAYEEVVRLVKGTDAQVLTVKTTVDVNLQRYAEQSVQAMLRQHGQDSRVSQAAMVSMEVDGAVTAIVGGRDYGESQFNRATQAQRQPGSSFKPFVYLTALENGYAPNSIVVDAPINIGGWSPQNYNRRFSGRMSLTTALVRSINTIPVRLAQQIGRDKIVETAQKAGIRSDLPITRSLPLGAADLNVMEMTGGYAAFASGGREVIPYGVLEIRDNAGTTLYDRYRELGEPKQIFPREKVEQLNGILNQVVEAGTGRRAILEGIRAAGKTGTTNAYRDAWFVGYTGKYVTGVWYGNDNYRPTNRVTGGRLPAMTWNRFMSYAHSGISVPDIPGVPDSGSALVVAEGADADGRQTPKRPRTLSQQSRTLLETIAADLEALRILAGRADDLADRRAALDSETTPAASQTAIAR